MSPSAPNRICVLLTRRRLTCVVVGRDSDRALLEGLPPATSGYIGWDPGAVLDDRDAHEGMFRLLESHVIRA